MRFVRLIKSKKLQAKNTYDLIYHDVNGTVIDKRNLSKKEIIEYYNNITKGYYDNLKKSLPKDEFQESKKDGPKFAKTFEEAVKGLDEIGYHLSLPEFETLRFQVKKDEKWYIFDYEEVEPYKDENGSIVYFENFSLAQNKCNELNGMKISKEQKLDQELANASNYGLISFDDLEKIATKLGYDPIALQDIVLEKGFRVQ